MVLKKAQSLAGKKILIIEDNPVNTELLVQSLKAQRLNIFSAPNGKVGLEITHKINPDLILLDVMMPEMDGFETCQQLKANNTTRDIPIIFITAKTNREDIEKGFSLGCDEYITKPFHINEVCNRIRAHLLLKNQNLKKTSIQTEDPLDITGMKTLIVDDNPINIGALRETLEPLQQEIAVSTNGKKAIDLALRFQPDLILLDIMMPEMNGLEVCRILQEDSLTKDIPIIFVTAKTQPEDIQNGFSSGCVDYILKPICVVEVLARVKVHLKIRKLLLLKDSWIKKLKDAKLQLEKEVSELTNSIHEVREETIRTNKSKSEYILRMFHELRTPMNAILGFSQIMEINQKIDKSSNHQENISKIRTAGKHLLALIDDILDLSAVESGKVKLEMARINPSHIIDKKVIPLISQMASERNISLINKTSSYPDISVSCDPLRLTQILLNISSNAIKYNKDGGSVIFDIQQSSDRMVRITVSDTGQGIPQDKLEIIFHPFYRLDSNNPDTEGVGVGLSITKRLIELMGGNIFVTSKLGEGSCFTIELKYFNE
jgi:CheY-like chemotaxis protein